MSQTRVGFALCGSYCTFDAVLPEIMHLVALGYDLTPIMSENARFTNTRFGRGVDFANKLETICGKPVICSIKDAEPLGPQKLLDALIVAPCTGNTLGKLANGITDSAVTMAVKSHLRNARPVIIAISTNDALGASGQNIARLLNNKNIYFVPYSQDSPETKPNSMVARMNLIDTTLELALQGKQLSPVIL